MGKYTEQLKHIVARKMGKGMTRDQAFTLLKSSIGNAPHKYEREIAEIIDMADGDRTDHDQKCIYARKEWSAIERERFADLEALQESGWTP